MPLPASATGFVGREDELAEIAALLSDASCRLLTIVGPGGIGKTRLALQTAEQQLPHFSDGVYFVPLASVNSPDLLAAAIAAALPVTFYSPDDLRLQISHYLSQKQILLVIDNFEHLLDGVDLLTEILQAASGVKLLVTSRERLNVQEEWVFTLDGLESASAVQLFTQRAQQIQTHFTLSKNMEAVNLICQRVEGMPLALELAASWLRAMSCQQIAAHVQSSHDLLSTPLRNVPERHRSMSAVFEQSWRLLSETEQNALMKFSVFRGGFDWDAAEQVAGASLPLLAGLVDKSLIRLNPSGRYDLHELLRQYAADKLAESGETDAITEGHFAFFLNLAEQEEAQIYGREQLVWLDRIETELDNVRAALAWALHGEEVESGLRLASALRPHWEYRNHADEGLDWLERLLAIAENVSSDVQAKALWCTGELAGQADDGERAYALGREALTLARQHNHRQSIAWALSCMGFWGSSVPSGVDFQLLPDTESNLDESLALFRELDDPYGLSHALRRRAVLAINRGHYPLAQGLADEALLRARAVGDRIAAAWSLNMLGDLAWLNDPARSAALQQDSLALFREIHDDFAAIFPLYSLARVAQAAGNNLQALSLYRGSLVALKEIGLHELRYRLVRDIVAGLAIIAARQGLPDRAVRLLGSVDLPLQETEFASFGAVASDVAALRAHRGAAA